MRCRWLLRYAQRHRLIEAYGWVREVGAPRPECICDRSLQGCICGPFTHPSGLSGGRQIHRHFLLRLASGGRNKFGRPWLPYEALQAAAKRCGLGTLRFDPIFGARGATQYVTKYMVKSLGAHDAPVVSADARPCSVCLGRGFFGGTKPRAWRTAGGKRRCPECNGRGVVVAKLHRAPRRYALSVPDDTPRAEGWSYTWKPPALIALETTGELIARDAVFWSVDTS
jgi:hypothetical protein